MSYIAQISLYLPLLLCPLPAQCIIVQSALLQNNGQYIALWGDSHRQTSSATDQRQLAALARSLQKKYISDEHPIQVLIEEPPVFEQRIRKCLHRDAPLILYDAQQVIRQTVETTSIHPINIEMRGIANACCMILQAERITPYLKNIVYDDAYGSYPLKTLTIDSLISSFDALRTTCLQIIATKAPSEQETWNAVLRSATTYFSQCKELLESIDSRATIIDCKRNLSHDATFKLAYTIQQSFAHLFDIQITHKILELSSHQNVALCAGFFHMNTIEQLLLTQKDIFSCYSSPREFTRTRPLDDEEIDLFAPKPTCAQRLLNYLCSSACLV